MKDFLGENIKNSYFFGVFDGHGQNGWNSATYVSSRLPNQILYLVSRQFKKWNAENLAMYERELRTKQILGCDVSTLEPPEIPTGLQSRCIKDVVSNVCQTIQKEHQKQRKCDYSLSGTTVASLILIENEVIAFNIGDSRIIMIDEKGTVDQITTDHSPL